MASPRHTSASEVIDRLLGATNDHDIEGIVGCFAPDYRNETPAHPVRGFVGRDQVRRNWTSILAAVPDVQVTVLRLVVDRDTVWTEQEHRGTRPDGSAHLMRGVIIFGTADGAITWARFYLEPVQEGWGSVDQVIAGQLRPGGAS
jgi:ketosteroid isomerase-like protein